LDVDILKNTSRVYNPVIKFQLGQIPLNEEGELTDEVHGGRVVSAVGPGWFQVDGYHLMYLADSSAAVEAMIRPALSDPPYCVVGPCPHINSQDQLVVSTYCVSAMKVLGAVLDRIWREVGAWVADRSIRPSHAVAEAAAFLLSDGRKVVVGHRVGHMFLDPIEMVVERGEVGDLNARWACFGVECI